MRLKFVRVGFMSAAVLTIAYFAATCGTLSAADPFDGLVKFDRIWQTVDQHFYDADFNGVDWEKARQEFAPHAEACHDLEQLAQVANRMLASLRTSHTRFYTRDDVEYYFLASLFQRTYPPELVAELFYGGEVRYVGIGLLTKKLNNGFRVVGVLDGGPAATAGLRRGQVVLTANGMAFHPLRSFAGRAGESVELLIREGSDGVTRALTVIPEWIAPQKMMMEALEASLRVIQREEHRIAYAHMWSYAGAALHERLRQEIAEGTFHDADALVLDLRDGWGGASPEYINLFNHQVPQLSYFNREQAGVTMGAQWRKPVALLVNERTRSGKELLAHAFRAHEIGPVVGMRTSGAVTAGRFFLFEDGTGLYLAVRGIEVDGEVLEGQGVAPTHPVPWPLDRDPTTDPQLERATQLLTEQIQAAATD